MWAGEAAPLSPCSLKWWNGRGRVAAREPNGGIANVSCAGANIWTPATNRSGYTGRDSVSQPSAEQPDAVVSASAAPEHPESISRQSPDDLASELAISHTAMPPDGIAVDVGGGIGGFIDRLGSSGEGAGGFNSGGFNSGGFNSGGSSGEGAGRSGGYLSTNETPVETGIAADGYATVRGLRELFLKPHAEAVSLRSASLGDEHIDEIAGEIAGGHAAMAWTRRGGGGGPHPEPQISLYLPDVSPAADYVRDNHHTHTLDLSSNDFTDVALATLIPALQTSG